MFYKVVSRNEDNEKNNSVLKVFKLVHNNSDSCISDCSIGDMDGTPIFSCEDEGFDSFDDAVSNIVAAIALLGEKQITDYSIKAFIVETDAVDLTFSYGTVECSDNEKTIQIASAEFESVEEMGEKAKDVMASLKDQPVRELEEYCRENDITWVDEIDLSDYDEIDEEEDEDTEDAPQVKPILEAIFNGNTALIELITGKSDNKLTGLDDLYENGYIHKEASDGLTDPLGEDMPCVLVIDSDGEGTDLSVDIICVKDKMLMEDHKVRFYEIISEIKKASERTASETGFVLNPDGINEVTENNVLEIFTASFSIKEYEDDNEAESDYIDFYNNDLNECLKKVFGSDSVRDLLCIGGVSGKGMSVDELIDKGHVKYYLSLSEGGEKDNVFAVVRVLSSFGSNISIRIVVCGEAGTDGIGIDAIMEQTNKAASAIAAEMVGIAGIAQEVKIGTNKLSDNCCMSDCSYSVVVDEDEIRKIEQKKAIRLQFYADSGILDKLEDLVSDDDESFSGFAVDIINMPIHMTMTLKEKIDFNLYLRTQIGSGGDPDFCVYQETKGGDVKPEIKGRFSEDSAAALLRCFNVSMDLSRYILKYGLDEQYAGMDTEHEGILIYSDGDTIKTKLVSGRRRPNMACQTLFGGVEMGRPYSDEFLDNSFAEMMSIDDLTEAAECGDMSAMERLAEMYSNGDDDNDIEPDADKAFYWAKQLAEAGNDIWMYNLGNFYARGFGVERDITAAAEWMKKAAESGDEDAKRNLELFGAAAEKKLRAENGDVQAQAEYAEYLMTLGKDIPDAGYFEESMQWAEKAAEKGNGHAYWLLGLCYEHGRGVEEDERKAFEYYTKGSELGNANCQHNLANMYLLGNGVKKNIKKAAELCRKSAEQGYKLAQFALARAYERGLFGETDFDKMIEWGEKAAENGPAEVQYEVGKLYMNEDENGKMIDAERSKYWVAQAAEKGHTMARSMLMFSNVWNDDDEEDNDSVETDEDLDIDDLPDSFSMDEETARKLFGDSLPVIGNDDNEDEEFDEDEECDSDSDSPVLDEETARRFFGMGGSSDDDDDFDSDIFHRSFSVDMETINKIFGSSDSSDDECEDEE